MGAKLDPWICKRSRIRVMLMTPGHGQTGRAHVGGKREGMGTLSRADQGLGTLSRADLSPLTQKPLRMSQLYLEKERKPGATHLI